MTAADTIIVFEIGGDSYRIDQLDAHPEVAVSAWRVTRLSSRQSYDVAADPDGFVSCECADCVFRQRACKHIAALTAAGLLPSVAAVEMADAA